MKAVFAVWTRTPETLFLSSFDRLVWPLPTSSSTSQRLGGLSEIPGDFAYNQIWRMGPCNLVVLLESTMTIFARSNLTITSAALQASSPLSRPGLSYHSRRQQRTLQKRNNRS
jgi:hypothetical protein